MRQLNIAIDFDNTYTADPDLFWEMMVVMQLRGHNVFVVTARDVELDMCQELLKIGHSFPIYFCGGVAKKWWCEQFGPGKVDIWIDDKPENILNNSTTTPEQLQEWRRTRAF